jgi:PAS domain S-box-containing protein
MGIESVHSRSVTRDLLSSQKHYEIILESMSEGILEVTSESKVVYANPIAGSLLGTSDQTLLASDFTDLFQKEDRKRITKLLNAPDGKSPENSEGSLFKLNGKQFVMKVLPIKEEGTRANMVILNDITEQKGMESQLRNAQKMEAIGTLAGGIAHDFNNLLMGVQGHTSLMLLHAESTDPKTTHLKEIEDLVQRGSDLTKQLLAFAREDKQDLRPANLNGIILKTAEMFGRTRKEITIREKYEKNLWPVVIDQGKIKEVLLNLYVNASQAMPGGGEVTLKTANINLKSKDVMPVKMEPGPYIRIDVSDTGVGMDEKTKERIFEPFFTTRELGKGTGLGLASVYGIIKNHGGFIDVQSEMGKGTTFTIYLPSTKKEVNEKEHDSKQIVEGSETILLVDDEKIILNVGTELLQSMGYQVLVAGNGKEAIEVFKKNQDNIDMIILDTIMPEMGGNQTYEKLKEINPGIKVLLSSGYGINDQAVQILANDCDGFIQKPFNLGDLSKSTRAILDKDNGGGK